MIFDYTGGVHVMVPFPFTPPEAGAGHKQLKGRLTMASLKAKHILVLEDEYFIATDLSQALSARGAHVVGPAGSVEGGLRLINDQALDAAVLDINLRGEMVLPVSRALQQRSIPFIFFTGYDDGALPDECRDTKCMIKPYEIGAVVDAVEALVSERGGA